MNSSHLPDLLDQVEILDSPGGSSLRCHFDGPFEGRKIRWQACLFTPEAWAKTFQENVPQQNIIEIRVTEEAHWQLNLCLKVGSIDRPTLRKAITMIRQYKRLQRGRHSYG